MNLLSPSGSRASFMRVVTTVHLAIGVLIVGGLFWLDPTWIGGSFRTFSSDGYAPGQRALLFLSVGSGGFHLVVAFSAVLVLVALSRGRAPAIREGLMGLYFGIVALYLVAKFIGIVGFQMQGVMFAPGGGAATELGGWGMVGILYAQAALVCIPAFAIMLSYLFDSSGGVAAPATPS